jgi:membrane-associated phospholipid phosphatase
MKYTYWFKANKNGMGWRPANWKGWLMIVVYIAGLVYSFNQVDKGAHSISDILIGFFPKFLILTALLIILTYLKGESIVWGEKEKDHKIP